MVNNYDNLSETEVVEEIVLSNSDDETSVRLEKSGVVEVKGESGVR